LGVENEILKTETENQIGWLRDKKEEIEEIALQKEHKTLHQ
jgi:hypothetical protein